MGRQPQILIKRPYVSLPILAYHLNSPILGKNSATLHPLENEVPQSLPEPVKRLANRLADIEGIKGLTLDRYSVEVWKADAYEWGEIEPLVLDALCAYLIQRPIKIVRCWPPDTASTTSEEVDASFQDWAVWDE